MEYFDFPEQENKASEKGFEINTEAFEEDEIKEEPPKKFNFINEAFEWADIVVTAVIAVVVIFCFVFRIATIDGDSMMNTLLDDEKVIITNFSYTPKNGDIVVISRNAENSVEAQKTSQAPIIKRVIATGGQTVNIDFDKGVVSVDGVELKEDYTRTPTYNSADVKFPLYVPEGYVFVLGDNRAESLDSRFSVIGEGGLVDERYILGHAIFRIFPTYKIGRLK